MSSVENKPKKSSILNEQDFLQEAFYSRLNTLGFRVTQEKSGIIELFVECARSSHRYAPSSKKKSLGVFVSAIEKQKPIIFFIMGQIHQLVMKNAELERQLIFSDMIWSQDASKVLVNLELFSDEHAGITTAVEKAESAIDLFREYKKKNQSSHLEGFTDEQASSRLLPFFLAGDEPDVVSAALAHNLYADSPLTVLMRHDVVKSEELIKYSGMPDEWVEAALMPEQGSTTLEAIYRRNTVGNMRTEF